MEWIRRLFLGSAVGLPLALAVKLGAAWDEFTSRVLAFEKHWNVFVRRLFGCPDEGDTRQTGCHLARSKNELGEFEASREKAKPLFGLEDRES